MSNMDNIKNARDMSSTSNTNNINNITCMNRMKNMNNIEKDSSANSSANSCTSNVPKKVFCFGSELIPEDSEALRLADILSEEKDLRKLDIEFVKCLTPDPLLGYDSEELFVLDVVEGIDKVSLIDDISAVQFHPSVTMHDFDIGFFIKLIHAAGQIEKVKIIGVPLGFKAEEVKEDVKEMMKQHF